jgi:hypothetical protein
LGAAAAQHTANASKRGADAAQITGDFEMDAVAGNLEWSDAFVPGQAKP